LATLLLSQGTPMLLAGDEFGRTQQGNNNAYCQDSEISWLNWEIEGKGDSLIQFVKRLTGLRQRYPVLRRNRFLIGEYNAELGVKDVSWINANGEEMQQGDWEDANSRCFGMLIDGRAQTTGIRQRGQETTLLLVINGYHDVVSFKLPEWAGGDGWSLLIDTNRPEVESDDFEIGAEYGVTGRSLLMFQLRPEATADR
jgi:glycogen operon protein